MPYKGQVVQLKGAYENDCPFCRTHNALLLLRFFGDVQILKCRDGGEIFGATKEDTLRKEAVYLDTARDNRF